MNWWAVGLALGTLLVGSQGLLQITSGRRQQRAQARLTETQAGLAVLQMEKVRRSIVDEAVRQAEKQRDTCHETLSAVLRHLDYAAEQVNAGHPMPTLPIDLRVVMMHERRDG